MVTHFKRLRSLQDRLAVLLGSEPAAREQIVTGMLRRDPSEATTYWLQFVVSVGIAILGLVLGSTAVVIGAMLIAPLMGPIVSFGMGMAIGSPFLILRSGGRILLSVVVAIGGSAALVHLLPFQVLNAEIAARTAPTVLDLLTAAFCAVAGVYAAMRPSSDVASAAAGTSIGISLVPPLCASGYGVGTATWSVAGGAALLFLTNLVAIVVVGTLFFAAAGFNQVNVPPIERAALGSGTDAPLARALARVLASRSGPWLRLLIPLVLLAAVYVPLRKGLDEVVWQIRVRAAVQNAVASVPSRIVQSKVRVERGEVEVALVLLGATSDADKCRAWLQAELRRVAGVTPRIQVYAVPDAEAFAGLESALRRTEPVAIAQPLPAAQLEDATRVLRTAVARRWPERSAGKPLLISLATSTTDSLSVEVVHLGEPLDAMSRETLERVISEDLGRNVTLSSAAIPAEEIRATESGDLAFVARATPLVNQTRALDSVSLCVTRPADTTPAAEPDATPKNETDSLAAVLAPLLDGHPRVTTKHGESWSIRASAGPCPAEGPVDAGAPD
jgi:uncharacterized hydrophobic protein (TIGR00271 family)